MQAHDFLLEIGTEELPAKTLTLFSDGLAENIKQGLQTAGLPFSGITTYATPRRLAVLIKQLAEQQPDRAIEKRGPALQAAYKDQQPTPALEGFARSCGIDISKLEKLETAQGSWLIYRYLEPGKTTLELMPAIIQQAITKLPINKPMRWAALDTQFARPVQWIVMIYGTQVVKGEILNLPASNITYGHRFHHPQPITLKQASDYAATLLKQGFVIADFAERRANIEQQIIALAAKAGGTAIIEPDLLNEVTGIIEWPVALFVPFDKEFLAVPKEALISAMQHHQKSFPVVDNQQQLLPLFITLSNIKSQQPDEVIQGNARVMRARLADAKFFYEMDCKHSLNDRLADLKNVIFQAKLGSVFDKSQRLQNLASFIAAKLALPVNEAARAGLLAKTDLMTDMVGEFPELQGIMGYYYALHDKEPTAVATAIREHYLPRFSGDHLPATLTGCAIALADRLDTLIGIFGINQAPTGDKDPFGLRRAALGTLRILVEKQLNLNLLNLLTQAFNNYPTTLANTQAVTQAFEFVYERFRAWYQEKNIPPQVFAAVYTQRTPAPFDFDLKIKAVREFIKLPEAENLIAANKRVNNILQKAEVKQFTGNFNHQLFTEKAEIELAEAIKAKEQQIAPFLQQNRYTDVLVALASLQKPVDHFFDKVMVNVDDEKIRYNRLELLTALRNLFLQVAAISEL